MIPGSGQHGQWVRTRTEADAEAFVAEKHAEQERALHTGTGTLILTGVVVLLVAAAALYARLG
ncbi:hypothetical protein [Streptomyces atriruber]|uniref:hypothetical protein n=1 Tax=Streptomyces atriruber TaxID=545121 RepID=UPI0006E45DA8|nr:hypothetical protein [Streptomyces atriruber]